jgi:arabinose-5-phosphate isomerase
LRHLIGLVVVHSDSVCSQLQINNIQESGTSLKSATVKDFEPMKANHQAQFVELLRLEAQAIEAAASRLEAEAVEHAIELLSNCAGKIVLVGIGKSGNIAQKIAATLTSTGTAAVFLHPSDALHGGFGLVSTEDVVIALSNSGETDEILAMLPHLKGRGVPLVSIIGCLDSTLARHSDVVLDATVEQEACPLNVAPTTSTTVALAIGDALAMTLMGVKGLTLDDFALNHPAGQLGKRLTLKVSDLMHTGAGNPTIQTGATWLEVITRISQGGLGAVNVVDDASRLVGIITDGDLRRTLQKINHAELETLTSNELMTRYPIVVTPDLLAYDALRLMEDRERQINVLPVVTEDKICVGLIRVHDIVRSGV